MVYADLDIDIWGRGRDAATAGMFTTAALKANYPYVVLPDSLVLPWNDKMLTILKEHFQRNVYDQNTFMTWTSQVPAYVFFQDKEDADLFQALLYIY